ncbi:unnamed protein product, partial [Rotaria sordida]
EKITHAVITVPAYFNDVQRQATILAATISGLNIIRIINESTAAAIFISALYENKDEKNILVFHLGSGTFDVSLVKCENDIFQVVATDGNTNLGGKDFDQRVVEYFIELFKSQTGKDVRQDNRAVQELRREVEKAKRILSSQYQANIEIESFFDNEDFSETFTRAKFEELNIDLFHLTMKLVVEALKNVNKSTIDEVVLVDGSTRIPKIQQLIKEFFYGKEPLCGVYLDESVVFGATIQAGFLSGAEKTRDIALLDVNPFSISIEVHDEKARKIIPRNIVIPFKECNIFTTAFDNQRTITFKVFEGESPIMKDNHILGKFDLHGIPRAPQGIPTIAVTSLIDINGILTMTVDAVETEKYNNIMIVSYDNRLSRDEINHMIKRSEKYAYSLKIQLNVKEKLGENLSSDDKTTIETAIEGQIKWLESNSDADVDELKQHKKELERIVIPIITNIIDPNLNALV